MQTASPSRRPLKVRQRPWAIALAARLARLGVAPRWISLASLAASVLGGGCFVAVNFVGAPVLRSMLLVCGAATMQLRLICNLLDGMVAIEGGKGTPDGELYNDLPDRFSDWILFLSAGYATGLPHGVAAGWIAAMLAVLTAYVRVLGRASGAEMHFAGPLAKQQRMALLCGACILGAILTPWHQQGTVLAMALLVIIAGSIWTIARRLRLIACDLREARR